MQYQLSQWLEGNSVHNEIDDWCCPDFSCCNPGIKTPFEVRKRFVQANEEERLTMMMEFLRGIVEPNRGEFVKQLNKMISRICGPNMRFAFVLASKSDNYMAWSGSDGAKRTHELLNAASEKLSYELRLPIFSLN